MKRNRKTRKAAGRRSTPRPGKLQALTTSALALTGIANEALADSPTDRIQVDYNRSIYSEDSITLPGGSSERYEVEMHQFGVRAPLPWTERWDFGVEVVHETMSGASPWFVVPDGALQPVQVMSGASISDERDDILAGLNYYMDEARLGFSTGYSTENDYESINVGLNGEWHFNEKNTTLSTGLSFSTDTIDPVDTISNPTRPTSEDKDAITFFAGLSQVIGRSAIVQGGLTFKASDGYLGDPYKQMFILGTGTFLPDTRPDSRSQWSWTLKFRRHLEEMDGTMNIDYQYYHDDWGMRSHTVDVAWHQAFLDEKLILTPLFRYYTQAEADFFIPFFLTAPAVAEYSNDYRLSAYGALMLGFQVQYLFRTPWTGDTDLRATWSYERYKSSEDFALDDALFEHPALVDYTVWTLGISAKF